MTNEAITEDERPKYEHDCTRCTFLGHSTDGYADLYHCAEPHTGPTVVARYGSLGHQYASGLVFAGMNPWIGEAKKLAETRGLLK